MTPVEQAAGFIQQMNSLHVECQKGNAIEAITMVQEIYFGLGELWDALLCKVEEEDERRV
jgi:hypothetical protein